MRQKASEQEAEKTIIPNHPFLEQFLEFANQNPDIKEKLMVFKAIAAIPGQNHRLFLIGKGVELSLQEKLNSANLYIETNLKLSPNEKKFIIDINEEELSEYKSIYPSLFIYPLINLLS